MFQSLDSCHVWNYPKRKKEVEKHTSNRPENINKTVRLPIMNHVIVHPGIVTKILLLDRANGMI